MIVTDEQIDLHDRSRSRQKESFEASLL